MSQRYNVSLKKIIRDILNEELGKVKGAARGYGAINTRTIASDTPMLGDVEAADKGKPAQKTPVKVSKAFLKAQWVDDPGTA